MKFVNWCEEVLTERLSKQAWPIEASGLQFVTTELEFHRGGWAVFVCSLSGETIWRIHLGRLSPSAMALVMTNNFQIFLDLHRSIEQFQSWVRDSLRISLLPSSAASAFPCSNDYPLLEQLEGQVRMQHRVLIETNKPVL